MAYTVTHNKYGVNTTPIYYAGWSFENVITSVSINKLNATVSYEVYTRRNSTKYNVRYNNWYKTYVGSWNGSIAGSTATHGSTMASSNYNEKLCSGKKDVTLDSKGNGSLRILTIGAYGSTWTGQDGFYIIHDITVSISGGWSSVTAGTVEIKDHGNNTFSIEGTKGTIGVNNAISKSIIEWTVYDNNNNWWKVNGNYPKVEFTGDKHTIGPLYLSSYGGLSAATTRKVAARITADGAYNDASYPAGKPYYIYEDINQYVAPEFPSGSEAKLTYTKNRLTIKEKWTLNWSEAKPTNTNSPVKGYRIRLIVNGEYWPIKNSAQQIITSHFKHSDGTDDYVYDTESTALSFDIWPGIQRDKLNTKWIKPGDDVQFSIFAYTKNGIDEKYWSGKGDTPLVTQIEPVKNAGVAHVKVDGQWKEGIVHIKVNGQWKEADVVYTKVNGGWQESE
jgi:hypothetical protein